MSVISEQLYMHRLKRAKLMPANCVLRTYSKHSLSVRGSIYVKVKSNGSTCTLNLLVVKSNGPALFGRDWIKKL